jgi:DNA-binding CsgD family transcriptional regulator
VFNRQSLMIGRSAELAVTVGAINGAAAGRGTLVLCEGPAGIGKTTLLRAACTAAEAAGLRVLTARGLALEQGFSFGIVRQLLEPVRAACAPGDWDALLDGAAELARRVFGGADVVTETGNPHATTHGLYWLIANLAAAGPLVIAVDDAHWADAPSLRWLSHLAARIKGLPIALLVAARSGPDQPQIISELRGYPATVRLGLRPLSSEVTAELVRDLFGALATPELCQAAYDATGGSPFLLDALAKALRERGGDARPSQLMVLSLGPRPVAEAVLRRVSQLGSGAVELTRALAVLGRPAPLRYVATLAGVELAFAARFTDALREAGVLAAGALVEFEHPIVRTAIYESIPPGERAMAHARAAAMLEADGADAELLAQHLMRSEPAADPHAVRVLLAAAGTASGRGAPDTAAGYLRRALAEPPPVAERAAIMLDLGLALASDRDQAAVNVLREAVDQAADKPAAALRSAGVLGIWAHHDSAAGICLAALSAAPPGGRADLAPAVRSQLEAELFANSWLSTATAAAAWARARPLMADPAPFWQVCHALEATVAAMPGTEAVTRLAPLLAGGVAEIKRDSLAAFMVMIVLIWNDKLTTALALCDAVLDDARQRGSMNLVANVCSARSIALRGLGRLKDAAEDARVALDFKLSNSPPLSITGSAAFAIEALTRLGRFAEAEEIVADTDARRPPEGWQHTVMYIQARGALRVAQQRHAEGLDDLGRAADGWRELGNRSPAAAYWRIPAITAYRETGRTSDAARLAAEQLELARGVGTASELGIALRAAAPLTPDPERTLTEALAMLEVSDWRYEHAVTLADLGAFLRRAGRRADAKDPLRRALDWAERAGAEPLTSYARAELRAAGARPRRAALTGPDALTSAERQVAGLAADGLSNRQIAQHLFITQATVETHLRHAFHKLGISSRAELPGQLGAG